MVLIRKPFERIQQYFFPNILKIGMEQFLLKLLYWKNSILTH